VIVRNFCSGLPRGLQEKVLNQNRTGIMGFPDPLASAAHRSMAAMVPKLESGTLGHIRISAKPCNSSEYVNGNGVFQCKHGGSPACALDQEVADISDP
jgi:hypothetical protein